MLLRGFQTRSAVDEFMAREDCRYNLVAGDRKLIEETHDFLQPCYEVTNKAQRDDATFERVLIHWTSFAAVTANRCYMTTTLAKFCYNVM
jgi:hypothetical protein